MSYNFNMIKDREEQLIRDEENLDEIASKLLVKASAYLNDPQDWIIKSLESSIDINNIVSTMRHVEGGQVYILQELMKIAPEIKWHRGGTLIKWKDILTSRQKTYYSQEQLETVVIDGGANGVLGRKNLAEAYTRITKRSNPIIYEISIESLIEGLNNNQIRLVGEHSYDLRVAPGNNKVDYLNFCRNHLKYERIEED